MKKKFLFLTALCMISTAINAINPNEYKTIKQVVIWGHQHPGHTHHWIHYAYHRTFKHLGFNTLWLSDAPHPEVNFSNSLFFAHGLEEKHLPQRDDCRYILHNVETRKYQPLLDNGRAIILQVYTHDCLERDVVEIDDLTYLDFGKKVVYMPWATDLLPHEIDEQKVRIANEEIAKERTVHYVGSVGRSGPNDIFENATPVEAFKRGCTKQGISFKLHRHIPAEQNKTLVQRSIMAPAIQSKWQCEKGYIPCRILKNISYGHMGVTNSETVYKLLKGKVVYNADPEQLAVDALTRIGNMDQKELFALMDLVRDKHTYVHRINVLLCFLDQFLPL